MLYDVNHRVAEPSIRSNCPSCYGPLIAKCGQIVAWHWAHHVKDCDPWSEPESLWHLAWKRHLESKGARVEVAMGPHRADAVMPNGQIVELQAGYLPLQQIVARERFYGARLIWLYRSTWEDSLHFGDRGFWWKQGSRSMVAHRRPLWWDMGDRIIRVQLGLVSTNTGGKRVLGKVLAEMPSPTDLLEDPP